MSRCEEFLRDEGFATAVLWVPRDNPRARAFYEKAGWPFNGRGVRRSHPRIRPSTPLPGGSRGHAVRSEAVT